METGETAKRVLFLDMNGDVFHGFDRKTIFLPLGGKKMKVFQELPGSRVT